MSVPDKKETTQPQKAKRNWLKKLAIRKYALLKKFKDDFKERTSEPFFLKDKNIFQELDGYNDYFNKIEKQEIPRNAKALKRNHLFVYIPLLALKNIGIVIISTPLQKSVNHAYEYASDALLALSDLGFTALAMSRWNKLQGRASELYSKKDRAKNEIFQREVRLDQISDRILDTFEDIEDGKLDQEYLTRHYGHGVSDGKIKHVAEDFLKKQLAYYHKKGDRHDYDTLVQRLKKIPSLSKLAEV